MSVICPTVTAVDEAEFNRQLNKLKPFAKRIHFDLMDGDLAPSRSPDLSKIWWPKDIEADIHLMYRQPTVYLNQLVSLRPNMVIIHKEADVNHKYFATELRSSSIKAGLALLQETSVDSVSDLIENFDQILIFSGHLGYQGGEADLSLLSKVRQLRELNKNIEIAWDGGINDQNIRQLADSGINVLDVGGYIAQSPEPQVAYDKLLSSIS